MAGYTETTPADGPYDKAQLIAKEKSAIQDVIQETYEGIAALHNAIDNLESKVDTVRSAAEITSAPDSPPNPPRGSSKVYYQIEELSANAQNAIRRVRNITYSLEV